MINLNRFSSKWTISEFFSTKKDEAFEENQVKEKVNL